MNCRSSEDLFSSFVEEELSQRERRSLEAHLAECHRCSTAVEELRSTVQLLAKAPSFEVSPQFEDELMDRIRTGEALRPTVIEWLQEMLTPARVRPLFLAGAGACAVWIAVLVAGPMGQIAKSPVIANRPTVAPSSTATPGSDSAPNAAAGDTRTASGIATEQATLPSPEAMLAAGPRPTGRIEPTRSTPSGSTETASRPRAERTAPDAAVANPSTPYQDEYILDQFYLNRSDEAGVHSIVPVSGRASDDVYIVF